MAKLVYFTATNRQQDIPLIEALIRSARHAGITEEFHAFCQFSVVGAVWHDWTCDPKWSHMNKLAILRDEMPNVDAELFVWIDSDTWFVRHPGDLDTLVGDFPFWIQGESELTSPKIVVSNWWGCPIDKLIDEFRRYGCDQEQLWSVNAGLFIVRREGIEPLCEMAFAIYNHFQKCGYRWTCDETPLAICGHLFSDMDRNRRELTGNVWQTDFFQKCRKRRPDGKESDWLGWLDWRSHVANPAIVHAIHSKEVLATWELS